jgi:hypothetical protein
MPRLASLKAALFGPVPGGNMLFNSVTKQRFYVNGIGYGLSVEDKDQVLQHD